MPAASFNMEQAGKLNYVSGHKVQDALLTPGRKLAIDICELAPGKFRAHCVSLTGCVAYGRTKVETRQKMVQAVANYLASRDIFLLVDPASIVDFNEA